ncbi:MAG TPA: DUF2845 domain-containing protein [Syntrophales bacterium]|nr:DUF2845 domain-containing protein [Syntrophales bacterium]
MKKFIPLLVTSIILYGVAYASDSFRCGNDIVSLGDSKVEVLTKCGEPISKEVTRTGRIKVEKWYYDKGAGDFIYVLIFHGGALKYVEQSGRAK